MAETKREKENNLLVTGSGNPITIVAATANGAASGCQTCPVYIDIAIELLESTPTQPIQVNCTLSVDNNGKAKTLVIRPKE